MPVLRFFALALFLAAVHNAAAAEDPLKVEASQDTILFSTKQTPDGENWGRMPSLRLMASEEHHRAALRFDFKDAAARPCLAAILRLTTLKCWPNDKLQYIRVHRLLRPFDEASATWVTSWGCDQWLNRGGDFDPVASCARKLTKDDGGENKVLDFDVTQLVQAWQAKAVPNYGFLLTLDEGSTVNVHFHSHRGPEPEKRPQLLLYYGAPPPRIAEMFSPNTLKPIGVVPELKMDFVTQGQSKGTAGSSFECRYFARGGIAPYVWKSKDLPEGLTFTPAGLLSGKPVKPGAYKLTLTATGADQRSLTKTVELVIGNAPANKPNEPAAGASNEPKLEPKPKKAEDE